MSKNYQKFIVISHARSGSNLLISCLRSNPYIVARGELFAAHNRDETTNFDMIMSDLFSEKKSQIEFVGCKIFYYHLSDSEWQKFVDIPDLKIIHLKRKNIFRTFTSMKIAAQTKTWAVKNKKNNTPLVKKKVEFNAVNLAKRLKQFESWQLETEQRFKNHQIHDIYYENITDNPNLEMKKISNFLNSSTIQFDSKLKKQNPEPLFELIENYQELYSYFSNTKWQKMLEG